MPRIRLKWTQPSDPIDMTKWLPALNDYRYTWQDSVGKSNDGSREGC